MYVCFFSVILPKIERDFEFMRTSTTSCVYIPMIYVFNSFNRNFFLQLALWAGKSDNHFIVHKNFNI